MFSGVCGVGVESSYGSSGHGHAQAFILGFGTSIYVCPSKDPWGGKKREKRIHEKTAGHANR